eukprot:1491678-Pyramimonas_sp.AAC.1
MQVSPRLMTAPGCSACPSKRGRPWHAPAPRHSFGDGGAQMPVPCCAAEPLLEVQISNFSAASCPSAGAPACASGGVHFVPSS